MHRLQCVLGGEVEGGRRQAPLKAWVPLALRYPATHELHFPRMGFTFHAWASPSTHGLHLPRMGFTFPRMGFTFHAWASPFHPPGL